MVTDWFQQNSLTVAARRRCPQRRRPSLQLGGCPVPAPPIYGSSIAVHGCSTTSFVCGIDAHGLQLCGLPVPASRCAGSSSVDCQLQRHGSSSLPWVFTARGTPRAACPVVTAVPARGDHGRSMRHPAMLPTRSRRGGGRSTPSSAAAPRSCSSPRPHKFSGCFGEKRERASLIELQTTRG